MSNRPFFNQELDFNCSSLRFITKNQIGGIKAIINITE